MFIVHNIFSLLVLRKFRSPLTRAALSQINRTPLAILTAVGRASLSSLLPLQEKDAASEKLASTTALLEASEKNLADAEARGRALEEAAGGEEREAAAGRRAAEERAEASEKNLAAAGERVSALEQEVSGLTEEVRLFVFFALLASNALARLPMERMTSVVARNVCVLLASAAQTS